MFLLPAIGAWISDGLILYLYFTDNRAGHSSNITHHKNGASLNDFVMCGNGLIQCLPHYYSAPSHDDIGHGNKRGRNVLISPLNSTTPSISSEDNTDITDDIIIKSVYDYSTRTDKSESSSQFAPESKSSKTIHNENNEPIDDDNKSDKVSIPLSTIENKTGYLAIFAIIRIILLTFPLSYAAYSGTRVPCVIVQFIFHGISSMIVVSHMLAVLILDPVGMQVSPDGNPFDPSGNPSLLGSQTDTSSTNTVHEGDAWTLLSLSLVSIMLHFLIVLHVRSTGPVQDGSYEEKRKRKRLAYAMAAQSNGFTTGRRGGKSDEEQGNEHHDEEDFADETPLLLPEGNNKKVSRNKSIKERFLCLPDQYEAFMTDAQARFEAAQQMWAERLEIMTQSLQQNNMNNSAHGDGRMNSGRDMSSSLQSSPTRTVESSNLLAHAINTAATNATKLVPIKPDPFKVLLQLFAYEDVWSGTYSRLDLAFAAGDGMKSNDGDLISSQGSAALSFYAPQLLSFLLHGAYFDISSKLEEWILKKCGEDLHFAHRCFWFLRSWCHFKERKPSHAHSLSSGSFGRIATDISIDHTELGGVSQVQQLRGVESNLYLSSCQGSIPASPLFRDNSQFAGADPPGTLAWNNYAGADGFGESTLSSSKFTADEQVLIEQLLDRVVQRGSRPARLVEYGSLDGIATDDGHSNEISKNDFSSPSALAMAVEKGLVPVDPKSGPSTAHLDCITSPHRHGFLPLNNSGEPYQNPSCNSLFFAAPVFLDALLSVADDLMNVSRSNRTVELRQRLKSLEVELLPSNVVYLPIQNMQHRVWRIVSDESIALSTNERVPCIITLEVIDYGSSSSTDFVANNESDVTSLWVSAPRPKHRHSTLIDKVANITQEGLGKLQDTIDHISHHGDGRPGVLDRRLSDFLVGRDSWKRSAPLYTTVGSYEDDVENHSGQDEENPIEERELGELQSSTTNESKRHDNGDDIFKKLPPPPLGGPLVSDNGDKTPQPRSPTPTSNLSNNQNDDIQKSPLGQWTPRKKNSPRLRKRNMGSIEDIAEEGYESDEDIQSPQGKQRKRVMFPPTTANMTRSESFGDEPRTNSPVEEPEEAHHLATVAPTVVFKEDWQTKTERLRQSSIYGHHPGWRLLPILIKSNDDLRQEQLASQLIQRMATILAKARVPVWLFPYEIVALTPRGGIIECVPDTISLDSLKRNDPDFTSLKSFFQQHFGEIGSDEYSNAKACFVESLAAYSIVCFLMQIKDRHNGNILLDNKGHIVHIDFGFYFLSSPGKNSGFESAPFKLTRDFVSLLGGPDSHTFHKFRELCYKTFIELRKNCYQLILLVEMLMEGNEDLQCFRGRPEEAVQQLKERFRLDLNDNGIRKYVDSLIDESLENWRTRWYDRYQRFCVGVL